MFSGKGFSLLYSIVLPTYDSLFTMFSAVASHPQVRRKLDDVAHKLNILYDKLRAQVLSPATLQGLHTILQHIWQYDYQACMQVCSNTVEVVLIWNPSKLHVISLFTSPLHWHCSALHELKFAFHAGNFWTDSWRIFCGDV